MTTIVAGRFQTSTDADAAVAALVSRSIPRNRISVFFVTPPGQHDATPVGGDEHQSPGMEHGQKGAASGATIGAAVGLGGALIGATAGLAAPMVAVAGLGAAAAGAYSGALAGAMNSSLDAGQEQIRHAGMMVAVDAADGSAGAILDSLKSSGGVDLEQSDGTWADGQWVDFDPTRPPQLVDQAAPLPPAV